MANLLLAVVAIVAGVRLHFSSSAPGDMVLTVIFGPGLACLGLVAISLWAFVLLGRGWARKAAILYTLGLLTGDIATAWLLFGATQGDSALSITTLSALVAAALCLQVATLRNFPPDDKV